MNLPSLRCIFVAVTDGVHSGEDDVAIRRQRIQSLNQVGRWQPRLAVETDAECDIRLVHDVREPANLIIAELRRVRMHVDARITGRMRSSAIHLQLRNRPEFIQIEPARLRLGIIRLRMSHGGA